MSATSEIIEKLFEADILITPTQAKLLTENDTLVLRNLLKFPKEAEAYLRRLEERASQPQTAPKLFPPQSSSTGGHVLTAATAGTGAPRVAFGPNAAAVAAAKAVDSGASDSARTSSSPHISTSAAAVNATSAPTGAPSNFSGSIANMARGTPMPPSVEIIRTYVRKPKKRSYQDFVQHFTVRFQKVSALLRTRKELANVLPLEKLKKSTAPNEVVAAIGLVTEKRDTKNEHIILTIEDRTGSINVLLSKNKTELITMGQDIHVDDVVGITGKLGEDIIFADSLVLPDVPLQHELKKGPDEAYAVCVSDIHFGNKNFMAPEFEQFLSWLRGDSGSEHAKAIAAKTHYVIIPGDVIEGVGIYPSQENDLSIPDIYDQYRFCEEVLMRIPADKHLIIIPGNHDIGRLSEPQPRLPKDVMPILAERPNTYFLSNPSTVRIHEQPGFPGFTILLYHGGSFIHYGNDVQRLFKEGGVNNPCAIMQYLLQRRHLAPAHGSTLYVPDVEEDQLVIDEVPDYFITGHLHMAQQRTWRGITMLSCSCWVPITDYQQKQGLKCDPGKLVLMNLQTREVQLLTPDDLLAEDA